MVYESFSMDYELGYDTFAFNDQCDNLIYTSVIASISSLSSPLVWHYIVSLCLHLLN